MPRDIVEIAPIMEPLGYVPIYKETQDQRILSYLKWNTAVHSLQNEIPAKDVLSKTPETGGAEFDWGAFSLKFCAVFFGAVIVMCCFAYGLAR